MQKLKVAVVYGGKSTEHEVSVHSAQTVCRALAAKKDRYEVYFILIDRDGKWFLQNACQEKTEQDVPVTPVIAPDYNLQTLDGSVRMKADVFFPVLHGTNGEDGTVQGLFESLDAAYAGCGVLASAMGMDKEITKLVARENGVNVLDYKKITKGVAYDRRELETWAQKAGFPVFVKPVSLGSSVGVTKVKTPEELHQAVDFALQFDENVMVEKGVDNAREIFCALLGNGQTALSSACGELKSLKGEFFDYDAKYLIEGGCETRVPADIPPAMQAEMKRQSETVFKNLRGCGLARADFLLGSDGKFYFSEINTLPGMSETSLFPQLFEASGVSYADALDKLVELAVKRRDARRNLLLHR